MSAVATCTMLLPEFLDACYNDDWETARSVYDKIKKLENEADAMKRNFRLNMPNSLFMPMPRTDLLELITIQDKVANVAQDIAGIMLGRRMCVPELIRIDFSAFLDSALKVAQQAKKAIDELDELLESGFKGKEIDIVTDLIHQLNDREHTADGNEREIREKLMSIENDIPPLEAMFLYNIIEKIGSLADCAQRVGSRLLLLLAR